MNVGLLLEVEVEDLDEGEGQLEQSLLDDLVVDFDGLGRVPEGEQVRQLV